MLEILQGNIASGRLIISPVDWAKVHSRADELSARHTMTGGHRSFDILHVATALEAGAREFLTFDEQQGALARAAGLKVKP